MTSKFLIVIDGKRHEGAFDSSIDAAIDAAERYPLAKKVKVEKLTYPVDTVLVDRITGDEFRVTESDSTITRYKGTAGKGSALTFHVSLIFEVHTKE